MQQLLQFAAKNNTIEGDAPKEVLRAEKNNAIDENISKKQIKIYEDMKNYIEKIIEDDTIVKNIETVNYIELKNYTIQFDSTNKYIHIKDIVSGFVYATFSLGNKKLVSGDDVQFLIFNILQRISCLNASEGCKRFCYANKSNNSVKVNSNSRNSRINNLILTMFSNFENVVNEVIEFVKQYTNRKIVFRFHESGDIYSKEYWNKIKRVMMVNNDIKFMYYTKTYFVLNELNEVNKLNNVSIRYSLDSTTKESIIKKCYDNNHLTFIVIDKGETVSAVEQVGFNNICNVKNMEVQDRLNKIQILKEQLQLETRKSYKVKLQREINKINGEIVDTNKKCTKCLKCFNKNNVTLFVATH